MKILHISTRLIVGGSQENTVLSCEGQARAGHDVHLAFGPIYGPEGSMLERVERFRTPDGRGITTHLVPHMVREVRPLDDRRCLRELGALIEQLRPDIVHTHSSKAGILGRLAAWRAFAAGAWRGGIVHTIHGPPFMPVEGKGSRRAKIRAKNWMYTLAERRAAKRCHVIVSVADAMTREFLRRGIGRPEQYITVRSGMEVGSFLHAAPGETREDMRARLGLAPGDFVIGTVARLTEHKGHYDLLGGLRNAMRADRSIKLLWVGDGAWAHGLAVDAWEAALNVQRFGGNWNEVAALPGQALADPTRDHVAPQVIMTGLVPPERVPAFIRAMDVLAHPSYREGLPRTVPQALLCGVPPVAYDADGTGEVCRDMETGRLVPVGKWEALAAAILWMKDHPRERAAMAERGREECREAFSAERMVAELERVYARALSLARGGEG